MSNFMRIAAVTAALLAPAAAQADRIGIYGNNSNTAIATFLTANGHTVVQNQSSVSGADYSTLDAVILLRAPGDAGTAAFVANGGKLITEWDASAWALGAGNLLAADDIGGGFVATGTVVNFTTQGLAAGIGDGIGTSYSAGVATEFFRNFGNIGTGVETWGTRNGGIPAILAGVSGNGFVIVNGADWADSFSGTGTQNGRLLLNFLDYGASAGVPEPATWALMILGFGAVGGAMRRRKVQATVRFA